VLKSFCKHWLWATKRENIAHKIAVVIIFRMFMISYTTQNKACKTSELKLQLLKCPRGYSWVCVYRNRMKPYAKHNWWSGSLRFCALLRSILACQANATCWDLLLLAWQSYRGVFQKTVGLLHSKAKCPLAFCSWWIWEGFKYFRRQHGKHKVEHIGGFSKWVFVCFASLCVSVPSNQCFTDS